MEGVLRVEHENLWNFWAKSSPPHPLLCHLIDAGHVALSLMARGPYSRLAEQMRSATVDADAMSFEWLAYLVAMHDLGKCDPEFQSKGSADLVKPLIAMGLDCTRADSRFRHEMASGMWVLQRLRRRDAWDRATARTIAQALRGHHGNFQARPQPDDDERTDMWNRWRERLDDELRAVFGNPPMGLQFRDQSAAGLLITGLVVLSDWIASSEELFPRDWHGQSLAEYVSQSRHQADTAVRRLGLDDEAPWTGRLSFRAAWPHLAEPRPIQRVCEQLVESEVPPGLTLIEAPMGEGKSEAAMYLAAAWVARGLASGMYLALPTAATSNQMHGRLLAFLAGQGAGTGSRVQLVHGMSHLVDQQSPMRGPEVNDEAAEASATDDTTAVQWFHPHKRSLLARFGVGTVDQALFAALNVKHGFLRLFGLAGKVLIVDEVHAYDAYMSHVLRCLLEWARTLNIPVIVLSATLPESRRRALVQAYAPDVDWPVKSPLATYPRITHVTPDNQVRELAVPGPVRTAHVRVQLEVGLLGDAPHIAQMVVDRLRVVGGCHAVVVNTVDMAQAVYDEVAHLLSEGKGDPGILLRLFHARFLWEERQPIEHSVLAWFGDRSLKAPEDPDYHPRPERAILVATQVVEQSLDLDFDELYTEMAPIDLVLQRAGRVHRHARGPRPTGSDPVVHLFTPAPNRADWKATEWVYQPYLLWKTWRVAERYRWWELPHDIPPLVEMVYGPENIGDWETRDADYRKLTDWEQKASEKAEQYVIPSPEGFAFALASSSPVWSEDGDARSYLTAKTRLVDHSLRIALLEVDDLPDVFGGARRPSKGELQHLLARTVSVPSSWLRGVTAVDARHPLEQASRWLQGGVILRVDGEVWRGRTQDDREFAIVNHPVYGVQRVWEGEEPQDDELV